MNRAKLNYLIDALLFIFGMACALTGILKLPVLEFYKLKIVSMPLLSFVHDWSGVIFLVLIIIHLILHINWIVCMTKIIFKGDEKSCKK